MSQSDAGCYSESITAVPKTADLSPRGPPAGHDLAIEGLRGLAALTVMIVHVGVSPVAGWTPPVAWLWPLDATAAVMIFFVLSGYVIGLTADGSPAPGAVRAFGRRRLVRLVPINLAAVLLACAAAESLDWVAVAGNLLFLGNYVDYAGMRMPPLAANPNLWSLNYEVVYYGLFAMIWVRRPSLRLVAAGTIAIALWGWRRDSPVLFLACYASGFLFWLGGLALAWHGRRDHWDDRTPWPSCVLLAFVTWKVHGLRELLLAHPIAPTPRFSGPVVALYHLDFLPSALWLLAAVSRTWLAGMRWLKLLCVAIPAAGLGWRLGQPGGFSGENGALVVAFTAALALWRWQPSVELFRRCAPFGLISYALYATSRPIAELVFRHAPASVSPPLAYTLAAILSIALSLAISWYLERRLQPALRAWLGPKSAA